MTKISAHPARDSIPWWIAEPRRLERDKEEVSDRFPDLDLTLDGNGQWSGHLPRWPLLRPEPSALIDLIGESGMGVVVAYSAAHPMVSPRIYPTEPKPEVLEWTQHRWHVLGDGGLCLLQSEAAWDPAASITDLLDKAAAWRVEYALVKTGVREGMSLGGITDDDSLDHLIAEAVQRQAQVIRGPEGPSPASDDET